MHPKTSYQSLSVSYDRQCNQDATLHQFYAKQDPLNDVPYIIWYSFHPWKLPSPNPPPSNVHAAWHIVIDVFYPIYWGKDNRVGKEPSGPSYEPARVSRAICYFRSLGSWEFGHGEPSHERATTKARLGSLWNLLGSLAHGSLGRLAEPIHVTYISCVSAKNSFNCMLPSRHNQDWIWYHTIKVFER